MSIEIQSLTPALQRVILNGNLVADYYPASGNVCMLRVVSEADRKRIAKHLPDGVRINDPPPPLTEKIRQALDDSK